MTEKTVSLRTFLSFCRQCRYSILCILAIIVLFPLAFFVVCICYRYTLISHSISHIRSDKSHTYSPKTAHVVSAKGFSPFSSLAIFLVISLQRSRSLFRLHFAPSFSQSFLQTFLATAFNEHVRVCGDYLLIIVALLLYISHSCV